MGGTCLRLADFVGTTTGLLNCSKEETRAMNLCSNGNGDHLIDAKGIARKNFIPAPPDNGCACNDCPHMKLNTLEKLYLCMEYEQPEIIMDEQVRLAALKPIQRMLEISRSYGL